MPGRSWGLAQIIGSARSSYADETQDLRTAPHSYNMTKFSLDVRDASPQPSAVLTPVSGHRQAH
jgi:hypothetical protein